MPHHVDEPKNTNQPRPEMPGFSGAAMTEIINVMVMPDQPTNQPTETERGIIMKLKDLLAANVSIKNQLNKAEAEIVAKVAALQTAVDNLTAGLADADLTAEQEQSVTDLQTAAQALDDLNPDIIPGPVEPPVPPTA
jgi:hypothetical protein